MKLTEIRKEIRVIKQRFDEVEESEYSELDERLNELEEMEINEVFQKHNIDENISDREAVKLLDKWTKEDYKNVELVKLEGSEKQISWAEDIRSKMMADVNKTGMFGDAVSVILELDKVERITRYIANITSAKWFIDNRNAIKIEAPEDFE